MSRYLRKYWLLVLLICLAVAAMVVVVNMPGRVNFWDSILNPATVALGWLLWLAQYLHGKSERLYILTNTLRLWLTNEPTRWNFSIELRDCAQEEPLQHVWSLVTNRWQQADQWHKDDAKLIINMPGYSLHVLATEGSLLPDQIASEENTVSVRVSNLELPFRSFRGKIENEALPLIEAIVKTLRPETEKYAAKISFSSTNPYFGYFVRRLELPQVVSFTCDLIETSVGQREQIVTVRRDQIDIVTDELLALQKLSKKYVRLAVN